MGINSALARVGVTGVASVADLGTTAPVGLAALAVAFVDVGAISEEGLTESRDEDRNEWTPWQSTSPIRTEITTSKKTFQITCWESSKIVTSLYYQVPVASMTDTAAAGGVPAYVSFDEPAKPAPDPRFWVFDVFDGTKRRRFTCPNAEVTDRGDVKYASSDIIGYPLTITAYPGADGISIRRHFADGWTAAP